MSIDLELTPEAVATHSAEPAAATATLTEKQKAALALLDSWREEDATDDPEELRRRDAEFDELKNALNRHRAEEGREAAFR